MLQKGFFKDHKGSWTARILADLSHDFRSLGGELFIKKRLTEHLHSLKLSDDQYDLLYTLALTGRPTLQDGPALSNPLMLEKQLKDLASKGVLRISSEQQYVFSNPLYADVLYHLLPVAERKYRCDQIANFYEEQKGSEDQILYFRGRGATEESGDCLLRLGKMQKENGEYDKAISNLKLLVQKQSAADELKKEGIIELGEIHLAMGNPEEAKNWLKQGLSGQGTRYLRTLEQLGIAYRDLNQLDRATELYNQGLQITLETKSYPWLGVVFKNRIAQNEYHRGHIDKAEAIFQETWRVWKNELTTEDQFKSIRSDLPILYYLKGDYEKAIVYLNEILALLSQHPNRPAYPIFLFNLALCLRKTGNIQESKAITEQCLLLLKQRKTVSWLYSVYNELGNIKQDLKDLNGALVDYRHAFELADRSAGASRAFVIAYNMATIHSRINDLDQAKRYFTLALRITEHSSCKDRFLLDYHRYNILHSLE